MSPHDLLKDFIVSYVNENNLDEALKEEVPKKWEKYGDFVLFDERTFRIDAWKRREITFWENIARILKCKRLAVKHKIKNDKFRSPSVTLLLGEDPWIMYKDNSILYTWHVQHNMFSAGNVTERHRIATFNCKNEIVVDLFAGIGYFTLPYLTHAKAGFVHACEWNPVACEALRRNLNLNKVADRCLIHEGDSKLVCPRKIANRINLGLLPSSENYWELACQVLSHDGGFLHIHEIVEIGCEKELCEKCILLTHSIDFKTFRSKLILFRNADHVLDGYSYVNWKHKEWLMMGVHILHCILSMSIKMESDRKWQTSIQNINFVKSYAPKIHHLVYDIKLEVTL